MRTLSENVLKAAITDKLVDALISILGTEFPMVQENFPTPFLPLIRTSVNEGFIRQAEERAEGTVRGETQSIKLTEGIHLVWERALNPTIPRPIIAWIDYQTEDYDKDLVHRLQDFLRASGILLTSDC